jgi:hypothetical protein
MKRAEVNMDLLQFILAGKSIFTIENSATGNRMTYYVKKKTYNKYGTGDLWFVSFFTGQNNENTYNYKFIGSLVAKDGQLEYKHSKKSEFNVSDRPVISFMWLLKNIGNLPSQITFWHEGRCARCCRRLTVPESIVTGYGPECWKMISNKRQDAVMNKIVDEILLGR